MKEPFGERKKRKGRMCLLHQIEGWKRGAGGMICGYVVAKKPQPKLRGRSEEEPGGYREKTG